MRSGETLQVSLGGNEGGHSPLIRWQGKLKLHSALGRIGKKYDKGALSRGSASAKALGPAAM